MISNTLLLAYRTFMRYKGTFLINLFGLSFGLACTLIIYLWIVDELSFDKFHTNDSRLYQVIENMDINGTIDTHPYTSGLVAQQIAEEVPEVEYSVPVAPPYLIDDMVLSFNDQSFSEVGQFVGKHFLKAFTFPLISGNSENALSDQSSIVLSKRLAKKVFGRADDAVGKQLQLSSASMKGMFVVSGVFEDVPVNSTQQFEFLLSYEAFLNQGDTFLDWGNYGPYAYVVLKEGADPAQVDAKIKNIVAKASGMNNRTLFLKKYSENYLYGKYQNGVVAGGRIEYVNLFSFVALFILVVACINFMNMATAKASRRMNEVGVKKAMGATRTTLVFQYFGEALVMSFTALILAINIVLLFLPKFNEIAGKQIEFHFSAVTILPFLVIAIITGLLAGSYPAGYLSGFNPALVLRGKLPTSFGELWVRRGLIVFQFAISVVLIVFVLVVKKQVDFVQSKNIGYDKEQLLFINPDGPAEEKIETLISELRSLPGVKKASAIGHDLVKAGSHTMGVFWEGKGSEDATPFYIAEANYDFVETLGLTLVEGHSFSPATTGNETRVICNEKAIQLMGLKNPIGQTIGLWSQGNRLEIIGVVKDFHFESLRESVKPLLFTYDPKEADNILVKIEPKQQKEVVERISELYSKFNPGFILDYTFADESNQALYASEKRVSSLSAYFALLAIIISSLGLFGLAAFTFEKRMKEIGIRRTLGAGAFSILYLLNAEFTKSIIVSLLIALPISYFLVTFWLADFAYTINLDASYFIIAGLFVLLLTWVIVSIHAWRASKVPFNVSLKGE